MTNMLGDEIAYHMLVVRIADPYRPKVNGKAINSATSNMYLFLCVSVGVNGGSAKDMEGVSSATHQQLFSLAFICRIAWQITDSN